MIPLDSTSYDKVPYQSLAFAQTHPDRMATIARMFDLSPIDVARCRVLELGCASGGNLIPMAVNLPDSTFLGIDLSRDQVRDAQATIDALNIRNITVRHVSILDIDRDWGEFDYIICHGVFSWVETAVQDKILQVASQNLSPAGVAYVSYNTYPGWHMRDMVRHMMRYHAGQFEEPQDQIEQARALLKFLASASHGSGSYGELLNREVERLNRSADSYLFHEHLEQTNTPLYFHQFIERAERAGLLYLSEAAVADMLTSLLPPDVAETLERISPDLLHLEQYMDFVRNRQFRQTLLCHTDAGPKRALTPEFMHGLMVSSRAVADTASPDFAAGTMVTFRIGAQRADTALPGTKAALTVLMEIWPEAIDVDALCAIALQRAAPFLADTSADEARRAILGDLFGGVMYGMVKLHSQPPSCTNNPSDTPRAHPYAAYQVQSGHTVVNAHHEMIELEALAVEVLKLTDGRRRRSDILDALVERFERGTLEMEDGGAPVTDTSAARTILADRLEKALASLTNSAVLVA